MLGVAYLHLMRNNWCSSVFSFISRMINCVTKSTEIYIEMFFIYIILIAAHRSGSVLTRKVGINITRSDHSDIS